MSSPPAVAAAPNPAAGVGSWGLRLRALQPGALLSGAYAWLATVALPVFRDGGTIASWVFAGVAPLLLLVGVTLARRWGALGRAVGIWGFLGACLASWISAGSMVAVASLEPVRSALGMAAWAMFAFGWGALRRADSVPEEDPHALGGQRLAPRGKLGGYPAIVLLGACVLAVLPCFAAWRVVRPAHALLAHAVAVACAVAMITAGASVAVGRGQRARPKSVRRRVTAASGALVSVLVLAVVGAALSLL